MKRDWLPEVIFLAVVFGIAFAGAITAFLRQ